MRSFSYTLAPCLHRLYIDEVVLVYTGYLIYTGAGVDEVILVYTGGAEVALERRNWSPFIRSQHFVAIKIGTLKLVLYCL